MRHIHSIAAINLRSTMFLVAVRFITVLLRSGMPVNDGGDGGVGDDNGTGGDVGSEHGSDAGRR